MRKYFYTDGVSKFGPFSKDELKSQKISRSTKVWFYGLDKWVEMSEISDLDDITTTIPPELKSLNVPTENKIKDSEHKPLKKTIPVYPKPNKSKLIKWIFGFAILIFISCVIVKLVQKQTEFKAVSIKRFELCKDMNFILSLLL